MTLGWTGGRGTEKCAGAKLGRILLDSQSVMRKQREGGEQGQSAPQKSCRQQDFGDNQVKMVWWKQYQW